MIQKARMRIYAAFAAMLLILACSDPDAAREDAYAGAAAAAERIECAIGPADQFERSCSIERAAGEEGLTLTLRNPDGGFRRLLVTGDGRGVIAADGAETARVTVIGDNRIEVAIAGSRYRLPATVRAGGEQAR